MSVSNTATQIPELQDPASAVREISLAHSPDSDDAFMFYALATNKVRVPGLRFTHTLCDIETLNRMAREGEGLYDVTAISFHAYPYIQAHYALLPSGGSVGDRYGLYRIVDLGKWWHQVTGLPLPLGGNAIRRSLGPELMASVSNALRKSIEYALDHRAEALAYALHFARDLDPQLADKFVGMYVNERTLDYGPDGREAVRRLLDMGYQAGIITQPARVDFV